MKRNFNTVTAVTLLAGVVALTAAAYAQMAPATTAASQGMMPAPHDMTTAPPAIMAPTTMTGPQGMMTTPHEMTPASQPMMAPASMAAPHAMMTPHMMAPSTHGVAY